MEKKEQWFVLILILVTFSLIFTFVLLFLNDSEPNLVGAIAGGNGKAIGNSCMAQCMGQEAEYFDASKELTQNCQEQCNVGTGAGVCLTTADDCCVPFTEDPDCCQSGENLALDALVSHHSGAATAEFSPRNYNDGVIAEEGSLPWGWTQFNPEHSTEKHWILFEWAHEKTFNEIKFYYADTNNRYLAGTIIQIWQNNEWVSHHEFLFDSYTLWERFVSFPSITSLKLRLTNFTMAPVGQQTNPNFREIEIRQSCS